MLFRFVLIAALSSACGPLPEPAEPVQPPPPQPHGATCETVNANAAKLGWCGFDPAKFLTLCLRDQESQAELGASPPLDCQAAAHGCGEFLKCR